MRRVKRSEAAGALSASKLQHHFTHLWLILSRADTNTIAKKGLRNTFFSGGNSACRTHARQHYDLYAKKCAEKGIPENPRAVPPKIAQAREEEAKKDGREHKAGKLNGHGFEVVPATARPKEFSKDHILEHTTKYIICTDQVSPVVHEKNHYSHYMNVQSFATADNLFYRNTLVAMRPLTKSRELASAHQVTNFLHNQFTLTLKLQVDEIDKVIGLIATCGDMWSAPHNKMPYFGAMAAYILIELRKKKRPTWRLKTTILGFRSVEGAHDGDNLGRYFFGMCRRVGIINVEKKVSKVRILQFKHCCHMSTYLRRLHSLAHPRLTMQPIMEPSRRQWKTFMSVWNSTYGRR